jgi:cupin superfamily acireductone dioxygenase involved in methionine salvage
LSSKFGETPAWLMGLINEGWESILPWEAREQVEADMYNNNIAFEDLNKERGFNLEDINTLDDINSILERLKIPPPLEY